ncbi:hypothetical protein CDAR_278441 [Caerostris darwini]|uniref:Uncharacterized protein n=1 Tax=Caerostris darwini TaxID=1538125 RepID=A0AAV4WRF4_9ARAC|nr:hypothetical protein CDAR_278441 [Caerostris darwini]
MRRQIYLVRKRGILYRNPIFLPVHALPVDRRYKEATCRPPDSKALTQFPVSEVLPIISSKQRNANIATGSTIVDMADNMVIFYNYNSERCRSYIQISSDAYPRRSVLAKRRRKRHKFPFAERARAKKKNLSTSYTPKHRETKTTSARKTLGKKFIIHFQRGQPEKGEGGAASRGRTSLRELPAVLSQLFGFWAVGAAMPLIPISSRARGEMGGRGAVRNPPSPAHTKFPIGTQARA